MNIMKGDEWKTMERVIPVSPWTTVNLGGEKKKTSETQIKTMYFDN